jgi:hypothetical protein
MKIEPCQFCGSSDANIGRTSERVSLFWVHCRTCYCDGPAKETVEQATDAHNRLSRIVRAAEEYHRIRSLSLMSGHLYNDPLDRQAERRAISAIFDAVEGGRADGR